MLCLNMLLRFVAIDGTSLTVCEVDTRLEESWFTFMLVGYTQQKIIIPSKEIGGLLNIEVDVLGKYSESTLAAIMPRIEELENKVKDLEEKLAKAEGN
jgi:riboflavin synthase